MKRFFTKIAFTALLMTLLFAGFSGNAQSTATTDSAAKATTVTAAPAAPKPVDTAWHPQRRLWGYTFGDWYYNAHADATNRGPESMYAGVPTYRNAFQFRRLYLGYDYEITKKFKAEVLLASEPNANVGAATGTTIQNNDNLVDGKMAFWIKNFNLRVRDVWNGTDFVIGEQGTPGFALNEPGTNGPTSLSEATWGYRSIEKTITDFHKNNSYDLGASLQGTFDPATKNFGYVFMVGNNSQASLLSAANANTGFYKIFYFDLWGKFFNKHLYVDLYADYLKTAPATAAIGAQEHNMYKIFVAYMSKPVSIGVEAYTQNFGNGVLDKTAANAPADATLHGLTIWVKGPITKTWNYFARFDTYNPSTTYINTDTYTVNTNYSSYNPTYKEQFYTFGLDYNPTKNVHFMPNVWLIDYKDQRGATAAGFVPDDHNLVYRVTFFYTFGK
ncbi:MAG TPA: hypothetical protein VFE54_12145 [Mucilaginibacter sp.]|nr:hypothetical protein [Mucilaginibacter sp.]